jgi:UDP-glucose 4-epimerase
MTLEEAVELVMYAFSHGRNGDIFVQKAPASTVAVLARAITGLFKKPDHPIKEIGTRHGEKIFEVLLSREEFAIADDLGGYYRIPADGRDLNYSIFVEEGEERLNQLEEYNSHNTTRLNEAELGQLLLKVSYVRQALNGMQPDLLD